MIIMCAACGASTPPLQGSGIPGLPVCQLGPPVAMQPSRSMAGYPLQLHLDAPTLAARARELETKASPWKLTLDADGFPMRAVLEVGGPVERRRVESNEVAVAALFAVLRDAYGLGAHAKPSGLGNGNMTVDTDTPNDSNIFMQVIQEGGPRGAQLVVTANRKIPLPPGLRELTDAELVQRWGADLTIGVMLDKHEPGNQCDPVTPNGHECDNTGPRTVTECRHLLPVKAPPNVAWGDRPGALQHRTVDTPAGYRWVVQIACDSPDCTVRSSVPLCSDAITGETLSPTICE